MQVNLTPNGRKRNEVEAILNDQSITKMSDDPKALEALKPNHLLLLKTKPILKEDLYIEHRWRQVQYMADLDTGIH